jgi:nucleoid DNA-binding protein
MLKLLMPRWTKSKTLKNFYKNYKYRKNKEHKFYIDKDTYIDILNDYFSILTDHLINGNTYKVPYGFGEFSIRKYKPTKKPRNYNAEKKYFEKTGEWKKIVYNNLHTDGYRAIISWSSISHKSIPNRRIIRFISSRKIRKKLATVLSKSGNIDLYKGNTRKTKIKDFNTLI